VVMTGAGVHHHHRAWPAIASMITAKLIYGFWTVYCQTAAMASGVFVQLPACHARSPKPSCQGGWVCLFRGTQSVLRVLAVSSSKCGSTASCC
jgi:hypothetical protein